MTRAYQEIYLNKAQSVLGDAFDYAINTCGIVGNDFIKLFSASTVSGRMENGEPATLAGMSGIEIASEIISETMGKELSPKQKERFDRSKEYWIGWAVAYYQWFSGRKYSEIFRVFSYDDLLQMYHPLHEADITKFVDVVFALFKCMSSATRTSIKQVSRPCIALQNLSAVRWKI